MLYYIQEGGDLKAPAISFTVVLCCPRYLFGYALLLYFKRGRGPCMTRSRNERNNLVEENLGLAAKAVELYGNKDLMKNSSYVDYEDLLQVARIALIKAAEKYNENNGAKFSTYAMMVMKNALIRAQIGYMTPAQMCSYEDSISEDTSYSESLELREKELIIAMRQSISALETKYTHSQDTLHSSQQVIEKIYSGCTMKGAGQELDLPYAKINSILTAARSIFKKERGSFEWLKG